MGFSLWWLLLLRAQALGTQASAVAACSLSSGHMGLAASRRVESYRMRDQIHVPCTGRQILTHCTTKKSSASCSFVISFNIRNCLPILLLKVVLAIWCHWRFYMIFRMGFFLFLLTMPMQFRWGLHWICRSRWILLLP